WQALVRPRGGGAATRNARNIGAERRGVEGGTIKYTVLITTYNRAAYLRDTLRDLARQTTADPWELIVVDKNSPDDTRRVVEEEARASPVELRYLFEPVQGKPAALNTGIEAS